MKVYFVVLISFRTVAVCTDNRDEVVPKAEETKTINEVVWDVIEREVK